jgi:hypothetical protein
VRTLAVQRASMLGPANKTPASICFQRPFHSATMTERAEVWGDGVEYAPNCRADVEAQKKTLTGGFAAATRPGRDRWPWTRAGAAPGAAVSLYPLRGTPSNLHATEGSLPATRYRQTPRVISAMSRPVISVVYCF